MAIAESTNAARHVDSALAHYGDREPPCDDAD